MWVKCIPQFCIHTNQMHKEKEITTHMRTQARFKTWTSLPIPPPLPFPAGYLTWDLMEPLPTWRRCLRGTTRDIMIYTHLQALIFLLNYRGEKPIIRAIHTYSVVRIWWCETLQSFWLRDVWQASLYPFHIKPIMRSQRRFENNAVWCERSEAALFDTGVRKGAFYVGGLLLPREVFWKRILAKSRSLRRCGCQCERVHWIMRRERPNNALGWWCPSALSCSVF